MVLPVAVGLGSSLAGGKGERLALAGERLLEAGIGVELREAAGDEGEQLIGVEAACQAFADGAAGGKVECVDGLLEEASLVFGFVFLCLQALQPFFDMEGEVSLAAGHGVFR